MNSHQTGAGFLLSCLAATFLQVSCGNTNQTADSKETKSSDAMALNMLQGDMTAAEVSVMSSVSINLIMVKTGSGSSEVVNLTTTLKGYGQADPGEKFSMHYCAGTQVSDCSWQEISGTEGTPDEDSYKVTGKMPEMDLSDGKRAFVLARYCDGTCQEVVMDFGADDVTASKSDSDTSDAGTSYDLEVEHQEMQTN